MTKNLKKPFKFEAFAKYFFYSTVKDPDRELYGKIIRVEFLKKTRNEEKFENIDELAKQITKDCILAKTYHRKNFS